MANVCPCLKREAFLGDCGRFCFRNNKGKHLFRHVTRKEDTAQRAHVPVRWKDRCSPAGPSCPRSGEPRAPDGASALPHTTPDPTIRSRGSHGA